MRRAMAEAEVGDDVFLEDPTVNRLQEEAARLFGREAGLYVPSGTMGNLTAILAQTRPGQEVICEAQGHIYNYEMASMSAIAGVLPRVIESRDGILDWSRIQPAIRPGVYYRAQTAMVALENTHNMAGGTVYPIEMVDEICDRAHDRGLRVHLDGARIFNAAVALGTDVRRITWKFDSVQFCLSKGLGAPVGSLIVGSRELIERCRPLRKMLGGGMRQAGVIAAAGLVALEQGPPRLVEDHENARMLAHGLARASGVEIDPASVQTNIVIFGLDRSGFDSEGFLKAIGARGVLAVPVDGSRVRMVTHRDVSRSDVERAAGIVGDVMREKLR
jgi:threonine aldolase